MADVDHPKTHVEDDKDVTLPREQPESPKHEGIDPLTESDTMYPAEDVKGNAEKAGRSEEREATDRLDAGEASDEDQASADLTADQSEVDARANTPDALLPDENETPDEGEKAEPQEPHTDAGNTSPANKTTSKKS